MRLYHLVNTGLGNHDLASRGHPESMGKGQELSDLGVLELRVRRILVRYPGQDAGVILRRTGVRSITSSQDMAMNSGQPIGWVRLARHMLPNDGKT